MSKPLFSHNGEKAEIKIGISSNKMAVNGNKMIQHWLLEKIVLKE